VAEAEGLRLRVTAAAGEAVTGLSDTRGAILFTEAVVGLVRSGKVFNEDTCRMLDGPLVELRLEVAPGLAVWGRAPDLPALRRVGSDATAFSVLAPVWPAAACFTLRFLLLTRFCITTADCKMNTSRRASCAALYGTGAASCLGEAGRYTEARLTVDVAAAL